MSETTKTHWGEIEEVTKDPIPDVSSFIEKSMTKFKISDFESGDEEDDDEYCGCIELQYKDPLMMHAIELHKYYNMIADKVKEVNSDQNNKSLALAFPAPNIPEPPDVINRFGRHLNFLTRPLKLVTQNIKIDIPEIAEDVVNDLLQNSLSVMLAHAGFETTHQSILDLLKDVLDEFLTKICYQLKIASDDEERGLSFDFPSPLEKVLVDFGMNGIVGLHDYYEKRVVNYIYVLQDRCKEIKKHYESLLVPNPPSTSMLAEIRVKTEITEDMEIPTVFHVPTTTSETYPFMEANYELLNDLEASTLNNTK